MKIEVYTDGACSGNPGKGGYATIMRVSDNGYEKEFSEGYRMTTNNRMELMAVIEAFKKLKSPQDDIQIYTDSRYVADAINRNWIYGWQQKDYKNVKNSDLWREFLTVSRNHQFKIHWVKGHSGDIMNERADKLAVKASQKSNLKIDEQFEATLKKQ